MSEVSQPVRRYTTFRPRIYSAPGFIGGQIDPTTGNVLAPDEEANRKQTPDTPLQDVTEAPVTLDGGSSSPTPRPPASLGGSGGDTGTGDDDAGKGTDGNPGPGRESGPGELDTPGPSLGDRVGFAINDAVQSVKDHPFAALGTLVTTPFLGPLAPLAGKALGLFDPTKVDNLAPTPSRKPAAPGPSTADPDEPGDSGIGSGPGDPGHDDLGDTFGTGDRGDGLADTGLDGPGTDSLGGPGTDTGPGPGEDSSGLSADPGDDSMSGNAGNDSPGGDAGDGGGGGGGGGGGWILCTFFADRGELDREIYEKAAKFSLGLPAPMLRGYYLWAFPMLRVLRSGKSPRWHAFLRWMADHRARDIVHQLEPKVYNRDIAGRIIRLVCEPACYVIGLPIDKSPRRMLAEGRAALGMAR